MLTRLRLKESDRDEAADERITSPVFFLLTLIFLFGFTFLCVSARCTSVLLSVSIPLAVPLLVDKFLSLSFPPFFCYSCVAPYLPLLSFSTSFFSSFFLLFSLLSLTPLLSLNTTPPCHRQNLRVQRVARRAKSYSAVRDAKAACTALAVASGVTGQCTRRQHVSERCRPPTRHPRWRPMLLLLRLPLVSCTVAQDVRSVE